MPALGIYQRVVIKGTTLTSEIWQTGFYVAMTAPPGSQTDLQTVAADIEPLVNTWFTALKPYLPASTAYTGISMYSYTDPSTHADFSASVNRASTGGTMAAGGCPIDTCCVVSLRSALPGLRGRNRMYVPNLSPINETTGCWDSTVPDAYGTATKALLDGVGTSSPAVVIVVSRTGHEYNPLVAIDTDSKPDVQRRRENRLRANHTQVLAFP